MSDARRDADLEDEIRFHLERQTQENIRLGMTPDEARRQAVLTFGGAEGHKERMRDARRPRWVEDAVRELRHGTRTLLRSPGFSLVTLLTLGLGMGALIAVFLLVKAILIDPLPYAQPERLVTVEHAAPGIGLDEMGVSSGTYYHYRTSSQTLETLALYQEGVVSLGANDAAPERIDYAMAGVDFFQLLGVQPVLGRLFTAADAEPGFMDMRWQIPVLLSYELWRDRFGSDPDVVGRILTLNERERVVVGVLPKWFDFPSPQTRLWMLFEPNEEAASMLGSSDFSAVGRLQAGADPQAAERELRSILPAIAGRYEDATPERLAETGLTPFVRPLKELVIGNVGALLWVLLAGMGFLFLVVCANIANLFLSRAEHRTREARVRLALGARSADLLLWSASESFLLAGVGALAGLLVAYASISALLAWAPLRLPRAGEVRLDLATILFTLVIAVLVASLLGALTVRNQRRARLSELASGGSRATGGREATRTRHLLIGSQIALALVLVVGSALMLQSFFRLARVAPGFDSDGVLTIDVGVPGPLASSNNQRFAEIIERVRAVPGVEAVGAVSTLPFSGNEPDRFPMRVASRELIPGEVEPPVELNFFIPGYLESMGIAVREGVSLAEPQRVDAPHPVLVSQTLARRLYPGGSAVGKRIRRLENDGSEITWPDRSGGEMRFLPHADYTIVGVVADVLETSLRAEPSEIVYVPLLDPVVERGISPTTMSLVVRTSLPALAVAPDVRRIASEVEPRLTLVPARTMESIVRRSNAREEFLTVLLLVAGIASLGLGALGIYAVVAYSVRRRTREIGIRMALGARAGQLARAMMEDIVAPALLGGASGLVGAILASRLLSSFLYQVSPSDPLTLVVATALLLGVAFTSAFVPARRAARVNPAEVLRVE